MPWMEEEQRRGRGHGDSKAAGGDVGLAGAEVVAVASFEQSGVELVLLEHGSTHERSAEAMGFSSTEEEVARGWEYRQEASEGHGGARWRGMARDCAFEARTGRRCVRSAMEVPEAGR